MNKKNLRKLTKGKQNRVKLYMDFPLYDKSKIFADDTSKERGKFPERVMKRPSIREIWKNRSFLKLTFKSIFQSIRLIKKFQLKTGYKSITKVEFDEMINIFNQLEMDQVGYCKVSSKDVFLHMGEKLGIPYEHVIVFTAKQNKEKVLTSPSVDSQIAVAEIYGTTGNASNVVSIYLDQLGFGAMPSHSLGGVVDYTKLAYRANLGYIGTHGLLINSISGPNNRIGAIFTNIDNLDQFIVNDEDFSWIEAFCNQCGRCRRECPSKAINDERAIDEHGHITSIDYKLCNIEFGSKYGCNICVAVCPFTVHSYDKIKRGYRN